MKMLIDNSIISSIVIAYLMKANKLEDTDKLHTSLLYQTEVYFEILVVDLILEGQRGSECVSTTAYPLEEYMYSTTC